MKEMPEFDNIAKSHEEDIMSAIKHRWPNYRVNRKISVSNRYGTEYLLKNKNPIGRNLLVKAVYSYKDFHLDERIEHEVKFLETLKDVPEIVQLTGYECVEDGKGGKIHFLEMEGIDGSVGEELNEAGSFDPEEAVKIIISVCDALQSAEKCAGTRIVHGNIKPAHILYKIAEDGTAVCKLSDFGCSYNPDKVKTDLASKLRDSSNYVSLRWAGSTKYAIEGDWSANRDVYTMGICLMEMLGAPCPNGSEKLSSKPLWSSLSAGMIPDELVEICQKASSVAPEKRYQTVAEFEYVLKKWLKNRECRKMPVSLKNDFPQEAPTIRVTNNWLGDAPTKSFVKGQSVYAFENVKAYMGDKPYIFISYSHLDKDAVYPFIAELQKDYNVWFDEGIHYGEQWQKEVIRKVKNCSVFLFALTENSLASENCVKELKYADKKKKPFVNIRMRELKIAFPDWFEFERYDEQLMCDYYTFNPPYEAVKSIARKCEWVKAALRDERK